MTHATEEGVRDAVAAALANGRDIEAWQRCGFACYLLGRPLRAIARQAAA